MNPTAIYSKSGKGVQEASGKTSLMKRPDRAVLSAIDGRATLADVAQKVGKSFDADFQKLVIQMDKDGFIREVSPGASTAAGKSAGPAAKAPPKPAAPSAPMDAGSDLDFSSFAPAPKPASSPPPPRPAAPAAPAAKAPAPKEQTSALNKAREEAEGKVQAERDRIKAETEVKLRAELESKARVETEAKIKAESEAKAKSDSEARVRADAEAKIKAARDAAVRTATEAKAKTDAESRRAREEAEKAKRESEDLKKRLEEERRAREEAERKARDEGERGRKELEEGRKRLEEEERKAEDERAARRRREEEEERERRKKREDEERKAEEERAERRKREEEEEKARQKKKDEERRRREEEESKAEEERAARRKREEEEEERRAEEERAARRKKREEEEALARAAEEEDRRKSAAQKSIAEMTPKPAAPAKPGAGGAGFDSLLADLDSFGKKDEDDAKAKEEADRKAKQDAARRAEDAARQEREEEERRASEERAASRKREAEEEERKAEEERAARRKQREDEDRREEEERKAEEKKRKDREEAAEAKKSKGKKAPAKAGADDDIPVSDADLDMDDVKRDQRALAGKKEKAYVAPPQIAASTRRRRRTWGKPVAIGLILLLAVAVGVVHVMPLNTAEYERAASEAIGRPVKIASGRVWLFTGLQLKLQGVSVGDNVKIANVTAFPTFDTLSGDKKTFNRIDLEGLALPQEVLGELLFAKVKGDKFAVARVVAKQLELPGPIALPKGLEADIALDADGALRSVTVRGPDTLVAKLSPKDSSIEFDVNAGGFVVPFAPQVTLGNFGMKGTATRQGMSISEWDGTLLNGKISGTATLRWGSTWTLDGVMTARGLNAAVFAPALVSEGRGEGTAKFSMSGPDPAKLGASGRYDGSFKIETGALGSVDLSRALRTGGRETAGRTEFSDLTGQGTYDRGAVTLRNIQLSRSSLNAGASADITREGALSGRIVADVRAGSQTLRVTLTMGGTAKDPQFRN
jgi:hypothetical protein